MPKQNRSSMAQVDIQNKLKAHQADIADEINYNNDHNTADR